MPAGHRPPSSWFKEMQQKVKEGNPSYDSETTDRTVGKIWSDLSDSKKNEISKRKEGKLRGESGFKETEVPVTVSKIKYDLYQGFEFPISEMAHDLYDEEMRDYIGAVVLTPEDTIAALTEAGYTEQEIKSVFEEARANSRTSSFGSDYYEEIDLPKPAVINVHISKWASSAGKNKLRVEADSYISTRHLVEAYISKMSPNSEIDAYGVARAQHVEPISAEQELNKLVGEGVLQQDGIWYRLNMENPTVQEWVSLQRPKMIGSSGENYVVKINKRHVGDRVEDLHVPGKGARSIKEVSVICTDSGAENLVDLITYIKDIGNPGHSFGIVVDDENADTRKTFGWDGDGSDGISKIEVKDIEKQEKIAVNYVKNDKGESVIAIGAPGSIERVKVEYPGLIEDINNYLETINTDDVFPEATAKGDKDIILQLIRESGVRTPLETESVLQASNFYNVFKKSAQADSFMFPNLFSSEAKKWLEIQTKLEAVKILGGIVSTPEQALKAINQAINNISKQLSMAVEPEVKRIMDTQKDKIMDEIVVNTEQNIQQPAPPIPPNAPPAPSPAAQSVAQPAVAPVEPVEASASTHMPAKLRAAFDLASKALGEIRSGEWIVCGLNNGSNEGIPAEFLEKELLEETVKTAASGSGFNLSGSVLGDYTGLTKVSSIEIRQGYGVRLKASDDVSPWIVFDKKGDAEYFLKEIVEQMKMRVSAQEDTADDRDRFGQDPDYFGSRSDKSGCECGRITGVRCQEKSDGTKVLWVPPYLRSTAIAAGGDMLTPYAERLNLSEDCYEALKEYEGTWLVHRAIEGGISARGVKSLSPEDVERARKALEYAGFGDYLYSGTRSCGNIPDPGGDSVEAELTLEEIKDALAPKFSVEWTGDSNTGADGLTTSDFRIIKAQQEKFNFEEEDEDTSKEFVIYLDNGHGDRDDGMASIHTWDSAAAKHDQTILGSDWEIDGDFAYAYVTDRPNLIEELEADGYTVKEDGNYYSWNSWDELYENLDDETKSQVGKPPAGE